MRVLILRSNPISPDPRVEKIARSLSVDGHQVIALGWDRTARLPTQEDLPGLRVHRLRIKARFGTGLMNLPALLVWQVGLMAWLLAHRADYQSIHACDFDTILPALACKFLWKVPVVYDIFDFYADHLRRTPQVVKNAIRRLDYFAISQANGVILVDEARAEQIRGSHPQDCIVVYNSPEDTAGEPDEGSLPVEHGSQPGCALRIAYVGLLQVERGIFEVLEVLRRHPEWSLDLAGFGGDEERIVALVRDAPNVTWHGRIAYPLAILLSRRADVLFATYDPTIANHRYSSPNKIFEAMMLGKPVIVAAHTNMDRMIQEADCGIVVQYGDCADLEKALARLADDPALRERLGKNARRAYDEVYSWEKMRARLRDFYRRNVLKS